MKEIENMWRNITFIGIINILSIKIYLSFEDY